MFYIKNRHGHIIKSFSKHPTERKLMEEFIYANIRLWPLFIFDAEEEMFYDDVHPMAYYGEAVAF